MARHRRVSASLVTAAAILAVGPVLSARPGGATDARKGAGTAARPDKAAFDKASPVEIRGNRVEYMGREGKVTFLGGVVVTRGTTVLRADELVTLKGSAEASARGNVSMTDSERKFDLTCQELVYTQGLRQVIASGTCHLIAGEGESLTVVDSDEMEVLIDTKEALARGNVRIMQAQNEARCGLAHLYGQEDKVVLYGEPMLARPPHEFRSDEVVSFLKEGRLLLNGNVRARIHAGQAGQLDEKDLPR